MPIAIINKTVKTHRVTDNSCYIRSRDETFKNFIKELVITLNGLEKEKCDLKEKQRSELKASEPTLSGLLFGTKPQPLDANEILKNGMRMQLIGKCIEKLGRLLTSATERNISKSREEYDDIVNNQLQDAQASSPGLQP